MKHFDNYLESIGLKSFRNSQDETVFRGLGFNLENLSYMDAKEKEKLLEKLFFKYGYLLIVDINKFLKK